MGRYGVTGEVIAERFRVLGVIGSGNMGEVHKAEDLQAPTGTPERIVAVKTIHRLRSGAPMDNTTNAKALARFNREVRIMRRLDHPHLTRLVGGGVDETARGQPYLAMEYLEGETLRDLIDEEKRLPVAWAAAIALQIANGLSAAHAAGVVHRDLKPSNVMLTRGGIVKILDFGMGRIVDDPGEPSITSSGVTVGTARYMAPEQFLARQVTQAVDLYALGCVLYEMLTGVPPFIGATFQELGDKHLYEDPTPIRLIRDEVPAELARLVDRLLAKDPEDRPVDAVAVCDALLPLVEHGGDLQQLPSWTAIDPVRAVRASRIDTSEPAEPPAAEPARPALASTTGLDIFGR